MPIIFILLLFCVPKHQQSKSFSLTYRFCFFIAFSSNHHLNNGFCYFYNKKCYLNILISIFIASVRKNDTEARKIHRSDGVSERQQCGTSNWNIESDFGSRRNLRSISPDPILRKAMPSEAPCQLRTMQGILQRRYVPKNRIRAAKKPSRPVSWLQLNENHPKIH